jgi:hypothetical protein
VGIIVVAVYAFRKMLKTLIRKPVQGKVKNASLKITADSSI